MSEASRALKERTENFAVGVVKFCETLPNTISARKIAGQLIDASTSVAANYRAACRAYTRPLFVSKLAIVAEEADESGLWLRIIRRTGLQTTAAGAAGTGSTRACVDIHRLASNRPRPKEDPSSL